MPKSLIDLIRENWVDEDNQPLEPSSEEESTISVFEQSVNSLADADKTIIADVIAAQIGQGSISNDQSSITALMTFSNIFSARFADEAELIEDLDLKKLNAALLDTDLSTKLFVTEMFAKEMQGTNDLEGLISELTRGLAPLTTVEKKHEYLVSKDQELSRDLGKMELDDARDQDMPEVRRSQGSFLVDKVFVPKMSFSRQSSAMFEQTSPRRDVADLPNVTRGDEARQDASSFYDFVSQDVQRELLEKQAVLAIQALEEITPEANKYQMSESDANDTVEVQEVAGGKYEILPGKNFTGIIQISRDVPEGEEESFDVLEFKNGVLVSGVEGARGESKIQNIQDLQNKMITESEELPFFVFNSEQNRQTLFEKAQSLTREEPAKVTPELDLVQYGHRNFQETVVNVVSDNIHAVRKEGAWGYSVPLLHSGQYHKEQKAAVDTIVDGVIRELEEKGISEASLEKHKINIIKAVHAAVLSKQEQIQAILAVKESLGAPGFVRDQITELKIDKDVALHVWQECKLDLVKESMREKMIAQMKERIAPEASSYKTYSQYRDKLIEYIVDTAIEKLPKQLTADQILAHEKVFLKEFEDISKRQDVAVREFLKAHRDAWFGKGEEVSTAQGHKEVSVVEKVAANMMSFKPTEDKEKAIGELLGDVESMLKDSRQGGIRAATWLTREWHDQQRNAVVDQLIEDIRIKLMADPSITTEMLYNNRDGLIEAVKEAVELNKDFAKDFLGRKENQTHQFEDIKARWQEECAGITTSFVQRMSDTLKENQDVAAEREGELEVLREKMEQHVKANIDAIKKSGMGAWLGTGEYNVERDVMAAEIADQACKALEERGLSFGELKKDHEAIMKSFEESIQKHAQAIEEKLEKIVEIGATTGDKARRAIRERQSEEKDANIADEIAASFSKVVAATVEASSKVPKLNLSALVGPSPRTPIHTGRSNTSTPRR